MCFHTLSRDPKQRVFPTIQEQERLQQARSPNDSGARARAGDYLEKRTSLTIEERESTKEERELTEA